MLKRSFLAAILTIVLCFSSIGSTHSLRNDAAAEQQLPALDLLLKSAERLGDAAGDASRVHSSSSSSSSSSSGGGATPGYLAFHKQSHQQLQQHKSAADSSARDGSTHVISSSKQQQSAFPIITSLEGRPLIDPKPRSNSRDQSPKQQQQQRQQQRQGFTEPSSLAAPQASQPGGDGDWSWPQPPAPPAHRVQGDSQQCTEYWMPPHSVSAPLNSDTAAAAPAIAAAAGTAPAAAAALFEPSVAVARRKLTQLAPKYCGKLGTYVPNYYTNTDGSMFGISIAPNADGSVIAVGSPLNGAEATDAGGASVLTSWSDKTCEYAVVPVYQPDGCYKYFGAQVALSTDGTTMVVMDGVEGIKTPTAEGNRPVVHVYRRYTNGSFVYMQKLPVAPRRAMAAAMAVSITDDAQTILVSFSVGEGFPDKRGSAQLFVLDGHKATAHYNYNYLQDLANLNMPAGTSVQFGQTSVISSNGVFIAVGTAANNNGYYNLVYMYKKDVVTGRFRIISSISSGEYLPDPSPICTNIGLSEANAVAMSQSGQFVLKVESAMLVVYEWSGKGMTVTWKRRCQLQAPDGYTFRTTAGSLSVVEVGPKLVKFAAGAYIGTLEAPEQMAVFLYHLDVGRAGSCPYRPAEKHVHNDAFSNYGAGVALSADGQLLIVGAPTAWDNNMDCQSGAVYLIDICEVADDGLEARIVTQATNTNAGCVNGVDANGNPCVTKQKKDPICKDVKLKDGRVIHYGAPGCAPTPSAGSQFWASSLPGPAQAASVPHAPFSTAALSAYTTVAPSIKGGVGVPVGSDSWLANQAKAAVQASYFGVPTASITKPKESVVHAAGWPSSVQPALGGLKSHLNTVGSATAAPPGISALSLLSSGIGALLNRAQGQNLGAQGAGIGRSIGIGAPVGGPVLPAGAVIKNLDVLRQQPGMPMAAPAPAAAAAT